MVISLVRAENIEQEQKRHGSHAQCPLVRSRGCRGFPDRHRCRRTDSPHCRGAAVPSRRLAGPLWQALQFGATVAGAILFELITRQPGRGRNHTMASRHPGGGVLGQLSATLRASIYWAIWIRR